MVFSSWEKKQLSCCDVFFVLGCVKENPGTKMEDAFSAKLQVISQKQPFAGVLKISQNLLGNTCAGVSLWGFFLEGL